jgi:hypothetical protein
VANSLDYLHGISLLHGDVKLDNVLLKTEPLRPLGVAPKVRFGRLLGCLLGHWAACLGGACVWSCRLNLPTESN